MNVWRIQPENPDPKILEKVSQCLREGGIVAHATETVYGLAVVYHDAAAIERLSRLKQRPLTQPYSLLVSDVEQIIELIGWESARLRQLLARLFPAPVTLVLPKKRPLKPDYWNQFDSLGFRLPDHALSLALVKGAGAPIITTSANIANAPPPASAMDISSEILQNVACVLDSGICTYKVPSTIIKLDLEQNSYRVIREGAFPVADFESVFSSA